MKLVILLSILPFLFVKVHAQNVITNLNFFTEDCKQEENLHQIKSEIVLNELHRDTLKIQLKTVDNCTYADAFGYAIKRDSILELFYDLDTAVDSVLVNGKMQYSRSLELLDCECLFKMTYLIPHTKREFQHFKINMKTIQ